MTTFQRRVIQKIRHEIVIEGPATQADLSKMLNLARQEAGSDIAVYDDSIMLRTEDENIVLYWDEEVKALPDTDEMVQLVIDPATLEELRKAANQRGLDFHQSGRDNGVRTYYAIPSDTPTERQD